MGMDLTDNQKTVRDLVLIQLKPGEVVDEATIYTLVKAFENLNPLTESEEKEVINELHVRLAVRMDRGACVKEKDHVSWYYNAKKGIQPNFWDRYRSFLIKKEGFNSDVLDSLDRETDEMMDMLGNPASSLGFNRRGLVIGDVQSGKTATYTALINKAADAGYRIVILLTGTIEKLRRQTQGRLDEGFIGLDSKALIENKGATTIGVGNIDSSVYGWVVTSTSSDFTTKAAQQFTGRLANVNFPVLFVIKKNKSVLTKLEQWLGAFNADQVNHKIDIPMLMIDDEADNASVNTNKPDDNPTAINANIRKLLALFTHSNYVAFTATPYANIFINPETNDEMLQDDLFPKDFIYALDAPTDYIGARNMFEPGDKYAYMLHNNDDCEAYLPEKHKIDFVPHGLPLSLRKAIVSFFIANAVRDLRGQKMQHRTMLINISRFIVVQNKVCSDVDRYVREMQRDIRQYSLTGADAVRHENIAFIKSVYEEFFAGLTADSDSARVQKYGWDTILRALHEAVAPIVVRSVNGGNAPKNLNYDENKEGLRLIAVGGISLSRGLTLEGLCISYYHRNSKMYDTLMQMGRWFGYRRGYEDVCQVWMTDASAEWYSGISEASDELRREIRKMRDLGLTPKDFGLSVRSDVDSLIVTAVNKMRSAKNYERAVSLNGEVVETPYLSFSKEIVENNRNWTQSWVDLLLKDGYFFTGKKDLAVSYPQILGVPKKYIIEFLNSFKSHYLNMDFATSDLIKFIEEYDDGTVDNWDILFAGGEGETVTFCGRQINCIKRAFAIKKDSGALQISGSGAKLGNVTMAKGGLTRDEVSQIENAARSLRPSTEQRKAFSQEDYFNTGFERNPLLAVYPVQLIPKTRTDDKTFIDSPEKIKIINTLGTPVIGLGLGIPCIDGREKKTYKYKINLIKWRELLDVDENPFEVDETLEN